MSPTRPTHTVTALDERHRAGVKRLVTGKLPGQWDDVDIDEALADEAAGRGLALVAETPNGVIEGFPATISSPCPVASSASELPAPAGICFREPNRQSSVTVIDVLNYELPEIEPPDKQGF